MGAASASGFEVGEGDIEIAAATEIEIGLGAFLLFRSGSAGPGGTEKGGGLGHRDFGPGDFQKQQGRGDHGFGREGRRSG